MKPSIKILIVMIGGIMASGIVGLLFMRSHAFRWLDKIETQSEFKKVAVGNFRKLDFSEHWSVDIRQGDEYKVEIVIDDEPELNPKVENIGGTLYFKTDTAENTDAHVRAKVEVPFLKAIKVNGVSKIQLRDFQSDSITIDLKDGCVFRSMNNRFAHIDMKTSGNVSVQVIDDVIPN